MKRFKMIIVWIALVGCTPLLAQNNVILERYKGHQDFTTVSISQKMFEMMGKFDFDDAEEKIKAKKILKTIKGINILVYENKDSANNIGSSRKLYREAAEELSTINNFEKLMSVRDGLDDVQFLIKEQADTIQQLLLLVGNTEEFVMIDIEGNLDLNQLSLLSKSINIKGMEHLDNLKQQNQKK